MYEDMTYEFLLNRMLEGIKDKYPQIDIREGSMIYDALAPSALELAIAYTELDNFRNETYISTASRTGKLQRCLEQGIDITVFEASAGLFLGEFNVLVDIGSRWNLDLYNYTVVEALGTSGTTGHYQYSLRCETTGSAPNDLTGELTPINDSPTGLQYASIVDCLIEGENEASEAFIEQYYLDYVGNKAVDGNVAQYEHWCAEYPGIGNYKIFPRWNGPNTVKVSILSASNGEASQELIENFQTYLDPRSEGMGNGVAPIGAVVSVVTSTVVPINISAKVSLKEGYISYTSIQPAIEAYLSNLAYNSTIVSYIGIAATILGADGIANVTDVLVNDGTSDVVLGEEEIPSLGNLTITVVN